VAARVLVCEDQKDTANMLASFLRLSGHEVLVCDDGESAISQVPAWKPTAAIIDIGLPGVTGYAVAQHIRESSFGEGVLLIAVTARAEPRDLEMARYAGFHWHFAKPAVPDHIVDTLLNPQRKPAEKSDGTPLNPVH
jgi:CheY-like chemotaxis protein